MLCTHDEFEGVLIGRSDGDVLYHRALALDAYLNEFEAWIIEGRPEVALERIRRLRQFIAWTTTRNEPR